MAIPVSVHEYLRCACVTYTAFRHSPAYSAQEDAAVMHVPGRAWAKNIACFADGRPVQAVVPADCTVNLDHLLMLSGAQRLRLAERDELVWLFPECEPGAIPPFGPMYKQSVFVDQRLATDGDIVFNAGTHVDAVSMSYDDFVGLVHPLVGDFADEPVHARSQAVAR